MKSTLFVLALIMSISSIAQNGEKNFIDQNYIEVTGKAEMEVIPNTIYLGILLTEKDSKNKISLQELEKQMTSQLQAIGVDISRDLRVKDISSDFKSSFLTKADILLSKEYQLIVRDSKIINKIYIELEKVGISNISIDRLDHSDIIEFGKEVKINTIKAAKEKAALLAQALDQFIGRAIYIQEIEKPNRPYTISNSAVHRGYASDDYELKVVEFEKIRLEYSILCRFELK